MGVASMTRHRRTKEQHFAQEAEKRVNLILDQFDRLGKLSLRSTNSYAPRQITAMSEMLQKKLDSVLSKFSTGSCGPFQMPPMSESSAEESGFNR